MKRLFLLGLMLVGLATNVRAAGFILVHDADFWRPSPPDRIGIAPLPRPVPGPMRQPLEVVFSKVATKIRDQFATTQIEQEFYNPNSMQLEGTFLFPVPKGAQIDKFTMEINGKAVTAELLAADKARGIYEDIVRRLRDPALLEFAGRDLFKARIFPIEANARKRITLSYSQLLKSDAGLVAYTLPLNTERFSAQPLKQVSVKIDLESKRPLKSIYSPSHTVEIRRDGAHKAIVGYEASQVKPDADFQLFFSAEEAGVGVSLLTHKSGDEDGYFVLLASPGADAKQTKVLPKDVAFVLDTSGSMAGAKLEQAKRALLFCVENLNDGDRFEVLRFSTDVEGVFERLIDVSADTRKKAREFIQALKPTGGTAIYDALQKALSIRPEKTDRPFLVIFLTDGLPTVGIANEDEIVAKTTEQRHGSTRIFCFGIGADVNTHLLDKITEATRAASQYVRPEEDIEVKVSSFFSKIKDPVLASPQVNFPAGVRVTKLYPSPLPDVFRGDQLVLVGRYSGAGEGKLEIRGQVNGEAQSFAHDVKWPATSADHEFIPRLWATRRVGYLLDEIRLRGDNKELKDEVTELARKFNIVTPYTAYLIVEDEKARGVASNVRTLQEQAIPELRQFERLEGNFNKDRSGYLALSAANSAQSLRLADSADAAISQGRSAVVDGLQRSQGGAAPAVSLPAIVGETKRPALQARADQYTQQSRFVQGRTFYLNNGQWIDANVQNLAEAKRVRVQFNSPEYFQLIKDQPHAAPWLALGNQVQVLLGATVYEVYE